MGMGGGGKGVFLSLFFFAENDDFSSLLSILLQFLGREDTFFFRCSTARYKSKGQHKRSKKRNSFAKKKGELEGKSG